MSLFENFPYTNLHELNLNWLIERIKELQEDQVLSVNGLTGDVILYQDATMTLPAVGARQWTIIRSVDGVLAGILFDKDGTGYIVNGSTLHQIYTSDNPPPYPVTSVNNKTGNVTLYTERYIQLPPLDDIEIDTWNFFRKINNVNYGIQFETNGKAYIMAGTNRYQIFTSHDEPNYPVKSVNGETGNVRLWWEDNNEIELIGINPESTTEYSSWILSRALNDSAETILSLEITKTGQLRLHSGSDVFTVYSTANPQPTWVDDPTTDIIEVSDPANGSMWGFIRETDTAPVGILFDNSQQNTPKAFIRFTDSNNTIQMVQLLTLQDIPSTTGVLSINGLSGVVVLTGSDINVSSTDTRKISVTINTIENNITANRNAMAFYEPEMVSSHNIPSGSYVFWNNAAYRATQAIPLGSTLSSTNLTPLPEGGFSNNIFNTLNNKFFTENTTDVLASALTLPENSWKIYKGSGSNYTGNIPNVNFKYGIFTVTERGGQIFVLAQSPSLELAINTYNGTTWSGWQEFATTNSTPIMYTIPANGTFTLEHYTSYLAICYTDAGNVGLDVIYGRWSDTSLITHAVGNSRNTITGLVFTNGESMPVTLVRLNTWTL